MKIWFDMDGTIADLYGVDGWLNYLINSDVYPYANARPLLHLSTLARMLNKLQREGYEIGIISWLSKSGTDEYNKAVTDAKMKWLKKHLASVQFNAIHIVKYGTPKEIFSSSENDILFDDEEKNRQSWTGKAFNVNDILGILKNL